MTFDEASHWRQSAASFIKSPSKVQAICRRFGTKQTPFREPANKAERLRMN
jgi:hypothetical protein